MSAEKLTISPFIMQLVRGGRGDEVIDEALRAANERHELCHRRIAVKNDQEAANIVAQVLPDAVIAPSKMHPVLAESAPVVPVFDLNWLFESPGDLFTKFADKGSSHGFFQKDANGQSRLLFGGFHGASKWNWDTTDKLIKGYDRIFGSYAGAGEGAGEPPPKFLGGRVSGGIEQILPTVVKEIATIAIQNCKDIWAISQEAVERAESAMKEISKDIWEARETGEKKPKDKTEELDPSGRDALLIMAEILEKSLVEKFLRQILEGRVPPEKTDTRNEFAYWLRGLHLGESQEIDKILSGRSLAKEDETGYALVYWLFRQVHGEISIRDSWLLKYLISKGAPIDPIGPIGAVSEEPRRKAMCAYGEWDPVHGRLHLAFSA